MEFVYGFIGAFVALVIFSSGVIAGWALKAAEEKRACRVTAEALSTEQRRRVEEEQQAWKSLHNYSVEDAYGMPRVRHPAEKE
jgi:hypothetical protein